MTVVEDSIGRGGNNSILTGIHAKRVSSPTVDNCVEGKATVVTAQVQDTLPVALQTNVPFILALVAVKASLLTVLKRKGSVAYAIFYADDFATFFFLLSLYSKCKRKKEKERERERERSTTYVVYCAAKERSTRERET